MCPPQICVGEPRLQRRYAQTLDSIDDALAVIQLPRTRTEFFDFEYRREKFVHDGEILGFLAHDFGEILRMALVCKGLEDGGAVNGDDKGPDEGTGTRDGHVLGDAVGQEGCLGGEADESGKKGVGIVLVLGRLGKLLVDNFESRDAMTESLRGVVNVAVLGKMGGA